MIQNKQYVGDSELEQIDTSKDLCNVSETSLLEPCSHSVHTTPLGK